GPPHLDPTERVLHRPSTTAALHLAAAAAAGARHLRGIDAAYADRLEHAARTAYDAALRHPDVLTPDDHARHGGGPYDDPDVTDDFCWAATELWLATGDPAHEAAMLRSPVHTADPFDDAGFDYDVVGAPARLDLQSRQPWGQPYAPAAGWARGSNGRLLNNLVVLGVAHLVTGDTAYRDAVATGVDHLFGRNALGQCYVTATAPTPATTSASARSATTSTRPCRQPRPVALAGGANSIPAPDFPYDDRSRGLPPQLCYLDEPTFEVTNDVCIRWNAPLVWVGAFLAER
ncbi:glycoside hydrolase family 9 protein, partial [Variovorax sp. J22R203]|uniref:glycoside hydrolase family 9 protein n=1 Tax=Variovorax sp. J22R203 TaxID=3053512 RepID=UPI00257817FF